MADSEMLSELVQICSTAFGENRINHEPCCWSWLGRSNSCWKLYLREDFGFSVIWEEKLKA